MAKVFARVAVYLCVFVMLACDRDPQSIPLHSDQGQFPVVPDARAAGIDPANHVAGSLSDREAAATAQLLALYPSESAAQLQQLLDEPDGARIYAVDGNEEAARLLSVIYAIRDADHFARRKATRPEVPAMATLVLVDELDAAGADAVVLRRATAQPADVIVLRTSADPAIVAAAMAVLRQSRRVAGTKVAQDLRLPVRRQGAAVRAPSPGDERLLQLLQRVPPRQVPGLGVVPAIDVRLSVPRGAQPSHGGRSSP